MGITEVRREIRTAMQDNHLTGAEAARIHVAAEKSYDFEVATAVRDLFDRAHDGQFTPVSPGVTPTATTENGYPRRAGGTTTTHCLPALGGVPSGCIPRVAGNRPMTNRATHGADGRQSMRKPCGAPCGEGNGAGHR
jgi:hypothetical protein